MSRTTYTFPQLNGMGASQFVQALGGVYEYFPWVTEQAATRHSFALAEALAAAVRNAVDAAGIESQLKLVRARPELAGKATVRGEPTAGSTHKQSGVDLNQCSPEGFVRPQVLNTQYNEEFGFLFVLTMRSYDRHGIIGNFSECMEDDRDTELRVSLEQIHRTAGFHLADSIVVS